jgi:hypothetical protein
VHVCLKILSRISDKEKERTFDDDDDDDGELTKKITQACMHTLVCVSSASAAVECAH